MQSDLREMLTAKVVTIPETIVKPPMDFMSYALKSVIHLNEFVAGKRGSVPVHASREMANNKRKRIVERLSLGLTAAKRRRFTLSKLSHALGDIPKPTIESPLKNKGKPRPLLTMGLNVERLSIEYNVGHFFTVKSSDPARKSTGYNGRGGGPNVRFLFFSSS